MKIKLGDCDKEHIKPYDSYSKTDTVQFITKECLDPKSNFHASIEEFIAGERDGNEDEIEMGVVESQNEKINNVIDFLGDLVDILLDKKVLNKEDFYKLFDRIISEEVEFIKEKS